MVRKCRPYNGDHPKKKEENGSHGSIFVEDGFVLTPSISTFLNYYFFPYAKENPILSEVLKQISERF